MAIYKFTTVDTDKKTEQSSFVDLEHKPIWFELKRMENGIFYKQHKNQSLQEVKSIEIVDKEKEYYSFLKLKNIGWIAGIIIHIILCVALASDYNKSAWYGLFLIYGMLLTIGIPCMAVDFLVDITLKHQPFTKPLSSTEVERLIDRFKPISYTGTGRTRSSSKSHYSYGGGSSSLGGNSSYSEPKSFIDGEKVKDNKINKYIDDEYQRIRSNNLDLTKDYQEAINTLARMNFWSDEEKIREAYKTSKYDPEKIIENLEIQEQKKLSNHSAYEGRIGNSDKKRIKSALGYDCMACNKSMESIFGTIGKNYIELHHKIPYQDMQEGDTRKLTVDDFCVLCPDCHRMIHKLDNAGDIDLLQKIIVLNSKN